MAEAVAEYARHRSSPERWMLGRFVAPAARLEEFADALQALPAASRGMPWAVSALALPPDVPGDARRIAEFNDRSGTLALVDAVETKASSPEEIDAALAALRGLDVGRHVLVVAERGDELTWKSLRNEPSVHILVADQLNTYDVLCSDVLVFTETGYEAFLAQALNAGPRPRDKGREGQ
jgi:hypothetical protein